MTMRKKLLITIACLSCVLCIMVTGTIAWLAAETDTIVNIFTPSDISVGLTENNHGDSYEFQMIPGKTYTKDPLVTVTNDIDCYVFVEIDEDNNTWTINNKSFPVVVYSVEDGWIPLVDEDEDGVSDNGVYYRVVTANATEKSFYVIDDNKVTIDQYLNKAYMDSLTDEDDYPTLEFTAYICQKEGFDDPARAWHDAANPPV